MENISADHFSQLYRYLFAQRNVKSPHQLEQEILVNSHSRLYNPAYGNLPPEADNYLASSVLDLIKLASRPDSGDDQGDQNLYEDNIKDDLHISTYDLQRVLEFSENYDDSDIRFVLLKQKKVPPTKAYVSLLSLYDAISKEAKKLQLNKYGVSIGKTVRSLCILLRDRRKSV